MGIHIPVYEVVCDRCGWVIASAPTRDEAEEIERTGRDCIVVDGRVYCCEQCRDESEAARLLREGNQRAAFARVPLREVPQAQDEEERRQGQMSKHTGPWTMQMGYIKDANGIAVCKLLTAWPEVQAVLLHAAEMYDELRRLYEHAVDEHRNEFEGSGGRMLRDWPDPITRTSSLIDKIESEIAAARKP